jgi:putative SOS response-associated peptidase YedK
MCERYVKRSDKRKIAEWFKAKNDAANLPMPKTDFNIAPNSNRLTIKGVRLFYCCELHRKDFGFEPPRSLPNVLETTVGISVAS